MRNRFDTQPQRNILATALALAFSVGAASSAQAGVYDEYWIGQGTSNSFSLAKNWYADTYTPPAGSFLLNPPSSSIPWLLHFGNGKYSQLNDDISLGGVGLIFDGSLALTIGGTGYLNLAKGIVNTSGKLQTLTLGITVAGDQVWDGGTGGLTSTLGGMDMFDYSLNLSRKVTLDYSSLQLGNHSGGNNQTTLTVAGGSLVLLKTMGVIGNGSSASSVYLQDSGSQLRVGTDLTVGNTSNGTLQVLSGGTASAANLYMGRIAGTSIVNVSGAGSTLTLSGTLSATQGDLTVGSGGQVTFQDALLGDFALGTVSVNVGGAGGAGASLTAKGTLNVGTVGSASLNINTGGTVTAHSLNVGSNGTLNLLGGTLVATSSSNNGTFNWASGTLELLQTDTSATTLLGSARTLGAGSTLQVGGGLWVLANTSLSLFGGQASAFSVQTNVGGALSIGAGSRFQAAGLNNDGDLTLAGGTFSGGLVNNGYLSGYGVITGAGGSFVNNGVLAQSGTLQLGTTGETLQAINNGNWDLSSGRGLILTGTTLSNAGTMNLNGDTISGTGTLINSSTGTLSGYGAINTAFQNQGRLIIDSGRFSLGQALSNSGQILLSSATASLGGAQITNNGRIEGLGQIDNAVINTGTLSAKGGALTLSSSLTNNGSVQVGQGATLLLAQGLAPNTGKLQLAGGTLDTNGTALTNAASGVISGFGDLRSGTLTNNGRVLLSGGTSAVYANVLGSNASQIILSGNSNTTFYGTVDIQSGAELRVSTGSVATFFELVQQRTGAKFTGSGAKRFEGGLSVGASPGLGTDEGDVEFGDSNNYLAEIGGTKACTLACATDTALKNSSFDKYVVLGQLSFGGTLTLTSWNGYVAQAGQHFDLFDWGSTTGTFANIDASGFKLAAGTRLDTSALYTTGEISVTAVPEPAHWAMLLAGLAGLGWRVRRQRAGPARA